MEQYALPQILITWTHQLAALKRAALGMLQPAFAKCQQLTPLVRLGNIGTVHRVLVLLLPAVALVLLVNTGMAQPALQLPLPIPPVCPLLALKRVAPGTAV